MIMWTRLWWWSLLIPVLLVLLLVAEISSSEGDMEESLRRIPVSVVTCQTTKGDFEMTFYRDWSPKGYDRVMELFQAGYYDDSHFFRVVKGFVVQFGISYTKDTTLKARGMSTFLDDPHIESIEFEYGTISFAGSAPNSRTSHLFISIEKKKDPFSTLGMNEWETPVGKVTKGMETVISKLYSRYGDMPPWGKGPKQQPIYDGPKYLEENFPKLDKFLTCKVSSTTFSETSNIPPLRGSSTSDDDDDDSDEDFFFHHHGDSDGDDFSSDDYYGRNSESDSSDDHDHGGGGDEL